VVDSLAVMNGVIGNAATLAAQKKAADLASCSVRSSRPSAGTQTHGVPGTPCPNCCMDAAKQAAAAGGKPAAGWKTSVPIEVDAQTESNHDTALTLAAAGGHARLVTLLLSRGADVEHRDKKGEVMASVAKLNSTCVQENLPMWIPLKWITCLNGISFVWSSLDTM